MKKTTLFLLRASLVLCLFSGASLFAQDALPTSLDLERAILIEEVEHDRSKAVELYRQLSKDSNLPAVLRRHAALRLGRAEALLGNLELAKAALEMAALGDDEIAHIARQELQDPGEDGERARLVREEARRWIAAISNSIHPAIIMDDQASRAVLALGESAVPELIRAIEAADSGQRVSVYAAILWRIGGPEGAAYLASMCEHADVKRRLSVALGLTGNHAREDRMVAVAERFLRDSDSTGAVQIAALGNSRGDPTKFLWKRYDVNATLALVDSPVPVVRAAALEVIRRGWSGLPHGGDDTRSMDRLTPALERALDDLNAEVRLQANRLLQGLGLRSPAIRSLLIRRMPSQGPDFSVTRYSPEESVLHEPAVAGLLPMLKTLGAASATTRSKRDESVSTIMQFYQRDLERASLPVVLEYHRLGYDSGQLAVHWIQRECGSEEAFAVLSAMVESPDLRDLFTWCSTLDLPETCWKPLTAIEHGLIPSMADFDWVEPANVHYWLTIAYGQVGSRAAVERVLSGLGNSTPSLHFRAMGQALLHASSRRQDEDVRAGLRRLLVVATEDNRRLHWNSSRLRQLIFARLIELGDTQSLELLDEGTRLGMQECLPILTGWPETPFSGTQQSGLGWLVSQAIGEDGLEWFHGYEPAEYASIWDKLLSRPREGGMGNPWEFLDRALGGDNRAAYTLKNHRLLHGYGANNPDLVEVAARHWIARLSQEPPTAMTDKERRAIAYLLDMARRDLLHGESGQQRLSELQQACLYSMRSKVRDMAIDLLPHELNDSHQKALRSALSDPSRLVVLSAIERFHEEGKPFPAELLKLVLDNPLALNRQYAIKFLAPLVADGAVGLVGARLMDSDENVRVNACEFLGSQVDIRLVPELLVALRDREADVRTAAATALRAIRFYHDEKAHWDRVFAGTELSQGGAAAALLKQAGPSSPLAVRLLAIRSLGSLGAAQTLPFLIDWTSDSNREIAEEARRAIAVIHAGGE